MSPTDAIKLANKIDREGFEPEDVDKLCDALREFAKLVKEASVFFAPNHDFEGKKLAWIKRAGLAA